MLAVLPIDQEEVSRKCMMVIWTPEELVFVQFPHSPGFTCTIMRRLCAKPGLVEHRYLSESNTNCAKPCEPLCTSRQLCSAMGVNVFGYDGFRDWVRAKQLSSV